MPNLPYIRRVVDEALRLYPPADFLTRTALEADEIGPHRIRKGTTVILPTYALHRNALLWDDPHGFNPNRFAPEETAKRHLFAYRPFGGGTPICIGAAMATTEAHPILASLLARFSFALPEGFAPDPRMWFTVRPDPSMARQASACHAPDLLTTLNIFRGQSGQRINRSNPARPHPRDIRQQPCNLCRQRISQSDPRLGRQNHPVQGQRLRRQHRHQSLHHRHDIQVH